MTARRVGLVVHGQPPELVGGTERLVHQLARALAARGDVVEIFSGSIEWRPVRAVVRDQGGPVPVTRVHRHDLFFERWDKLHNPFVERAYGEWLDAFAPEVVHVHHWARLTTDLVALARRRGHAIVASLHDLFSTCPRYHRVKEDGTLCDVAPSREVCVGCAPQWTFQTPEELGLSAEAFTRDFARELAEADVLVAPTEGHGRRLLRWAGVDRDVVALPPASSPPTSPATRPLGDRVARAGDPLRVGVFGHLHELKGLDVLLDAHARLVEPERVEVHVWGAPETEERDRSIRARAGTRPTRFHGAYEPADLAGAAIDVVVLPTLCAESYSFALDEAAGLACPVLASDAGALSDRATARIGLFARGDADALAARLERLAADPSERERMARAPAPARITADEHLSRLDAIYVRAIAAAAGRERRVPDEVEDEALARRELAFELREHGLRELLRSEGWEAVVADLQRRLDERGHAG